MYYLLIHKAETVVVLGEPERIYDRLGIDKYNEATMGELEVETANSYGISGDTNVIDIGSTKLLPVRASNDELCKTSKPGIWLTCMMVH
jgi:hypothetical protein